MPSPGASGGRELDYPGRVVPCRRRWRRRIPEARQQTSMLRAMYSRDRCTLMEDDSLVYRVGIATSWIRKPPTIAATRISVSKMKSSEYMSNGTDSRNFRLYAFIPSASR